MGKSKMKIIECEGLTIAGTVEADASYEHPIYYPSNYLVHVEQGDLNLTIDNKVYTAKEGEFLFVRKHTVGRYFKTWKAPDEVFREHVFVLHDTFIREVIREFELPKDYLPLSVPVILFRNEPVLKGLMNSLEGYITGQVRIDRKLIRIKTMEALHALTRLRPELIHVFNEFSQPGRADLVQFMQYNFTQKLTLDQFAKLSGRSISTFNREFKKAFENTPYQWIRQRRLELAHQLLQQTDKTPSRVYSEVGFEDLAHFSRSFKDHFGYNPSEVK
jgi:AraC-like DNA-binding protein